MDVIGFYEDEKRANKRISALPFARYRVRNIYFFQIHVPTVSLSKIRSRVIGIERKKDTLATVDRYLQSKEDEIIAARFACKSPRGWERRVYTRRSARIERDSKSQRARKSCKLNRRRVGLIFANSRERIAPGTQFSRRCVPFSSFSLFISSSRLSPHLPFPRAERAHLKSFIAPRSQVADDVPSSFPAYGGANGRRM